MSGANTKRVVPMTQSLLSVRRGAGMACMVAFAVLCIARSATAARSLQGESTAGWLERARLSPGEIIVSAKLDTGARTSSLDAPNLRRFERDGMQWVGFDVTGDDGRSVHLERPLVRVVTVKSALGTDEARPAVKLGICVGNVYRVAEVTLVDRSGLAKPLLIGRRFLKGRLLVDTSRRYLLEPRCPQQPLS